MNLTSSISVAYMSQLLGLQHFISKRYHSDIRLTLSHLQRGLKKSKGKMWKNLICRQGFEPRATGFSHQCSNHWATTNLDFQDSHIFPLYCWVAGVSQTTNYVRSDWHSQTLYLTATRRKGSGSCARLWFKNLALLLNWKVPIKSRTSLRPTAFPPT